MNRTCRALSCCQKLTYPQGGAANWGNGFLPAALSGHAAATARARRSSTSARPRAITREHQRANLDLLAALEPPTHQQQHARPRRTCRPHRQLRAGLPHADAGAGHPRHRRGARGDEGRLYGIGREPTDAFGRKCLLARRLVEQGVRFVQLYPGHGTRTTTSSERTAT